MRVLKRSWSTALVLLLLVPAVAAANTPPSWGGLDDSATAAFTSGFGIAEMAAVIVFGGMIAFAVLRKLVRSAL